jgi:hypothetical protein
MAVSDGYRKMKRHLLFLAVVPIILVLGWHSAAYTPYPSGLRQRAEEFLTNWYHRKPIAEMKEYIAKDNELSVPAIHEQMHLAEQSGWEKLLSSAFIGEETPKGDLNTLIEYPPTAVLKPLNPTGGKSDAAFGILPPALASSYFPPENVSVKTRDAFDPIAKYLYHLRHDYDQHLLLILYVTKSERLVRQGVVMYWILEDSKWKLAMLQGTD